MFLDGKRATFLRAEVVPRKLGVARYAQSLAAIIGWLRDDPALELGAAAERLVDAAQIVASTRADAIARARDYIKQLYRSMYDQGVIAANDWASLRAVAATELELPRDLRPKNAYNLIRLLDLAIRWLAGEPPEVRVSEALHRAARRARGSSTPCPDRCPRPVGRRCTTATGGTLR